ncbi:MAG: hypothetical protein A3A33_05195 [Candidatus Yanofskybacteria bacterium RIFCSPLOWO2_01_FULL_49_25]|uniref:Uncharacterized protein n=1 Tax=Candidatus Yanofskybacteria bacterium RIFCSPLOWO2_01_FULL_49_25 TaxID=1802701 RepID=A0A1F8GSI9_9BACT|nr:MAG: hypothetical protein A3A33_05195 [Candidatus Yanofskybacteria bacterium RIFCSPLOWO2_01_FULL_49_25]
MKLSVRVKTGKHTAKVERIDVTHYEVHVTARPEKGRANTAVLRALARHLDIASSRLRVISGHTSQSKIVEIY